MRFRALLLIALLAGCHREARETRDAPLPFSQTQLATTTTVMAGGTQPAAPDPRIARYEKNAWHVSEGQRLYTEFNCVECHAHGGGGIGVPLIDDEWIYGSSSPQIVATLIQGRPNGMPSYRNLLTEEQMWQIAAYVRSVAGQVPKDVPPSRSDTMANTPPVTLESKPLLRDSNEDAAGR
ncbi:cytochrome c [Sphingomonas cannabina]|uniref:c-type cytochrome n=1 Tax=Sphingomonas cannabina TaxID=2899123 RepID=UPI001F234C90|nr:cytochrome c [Sphingomonas cannabina]UIJ44843.1 cytochrome c [Sphingomonas cannabina]